MSRVGRLPIAIPADDIIAPPVLFKIAFTYNYIYLKFI